jgi:hypothetical protein
LSPTPPSRLSLSHFRVPLCPRSCSYRFSASCAARRAEGVPRPGRPPSADGAASRSVRRKPRDTRRGVHLPCAAQTTPTPRRAPCQTTFHAAHESWCVLRRRYAATIDALTARNEKLVAANTELTAANTNLATTISALSAENSKLAAQCGAAVDATSEALLQDGTTRTHERALSSLCTLV